MTQVVGLFSNQAAASRVVDALATLDLEEDAFRTIEAPDAIDAAPDVAAVPVPPTGSARGAVIAPWPDFEALDIDDEAAEFFRRSVADGAVLIVAEVDDDDAVTAVRRIFEKHDGRVATG